MGDEMRMLNSLDSLLEKLDIAYLTVGRNTREGEFAKIAPMERAQKHDLIFINAPNGNTMRILKETKASCVLLEKSWGQRHLSEIGKIEKHIRLVTHPRLVVAKLLKQICGEDEAMPSGIHPTAIIDSRADIHMSVFVGPYCIIGDCSIGKGSRIHAHAIINDRVRIGKNVTVREHCIIGSHGFAFVRDDDGILIGFNPTGGVVIEDNVEIFPLANVDRGTFEDTVIKSGTKIDHFAHVSHNSKIGKNCVITAGVVFCGSSEMGDSSWAGIGSIIKQSTRVGKDTVLGMGAVVLKDVEDGDVVAGVPAKSLQRGKK